MKFYDAWEELKDWLVKREESGVFIEGLYQEVLDKIDELEMKHE